MAALFTWLASGPMSPWATLPSQIGSGGTGSLMRSSAEAGGWFLLALLLAVQMGFAVVLLVSLRKRARGTRDPAPRPRLRLVVSRPRGTRSRSSSATGPGT